jgi:PPOX class probable F420-dependent enzyme
MRMHPVEARRRFAEARVARLATVSAGGQPHLVPIVFAVEGDVLYTAVDDKPKATRALRRLDNIAGNAQVAVLADHYDDDWTQLWWARADGVARVVGGAEAERAIDLLARRYAVYGERRPPGPAVAVEVSRWSGWLAAGDPSTSS